MSEGVFDIIKLSGYGNLPGFFEILPKIGVEGNVLQSLQGTTTRGILAIVFPNGEAALTGWGMLASDKILPNMLQKITKYKMDPHIPPVYGEGKLFFGTTPLSR